jgi:hypothetical protein
MDTLGLKKIEESSIIDRNGQKMRDLMSPCESGISLDLMMN